MSISGQALPDRILHHFRTLRKNAKDAESLLWNLLRNRKLGGFKFRRQHPIKSYILDFYCIERNVAIELDGGQHNCPEELIYDLKRTEYLNATGISVIRFWNHEILKYPEGILEIIWEALKDRTEQ